MTHPVYIYIEAIYTVVRVLGFEVNSHTIWDNKTKGETGRFGPCSPSSTVFRKRNYKNLYRNR